MIFVDVHTDTLLLYRIKIEKLSHQPIFSSHVCSSQFADRRCVIENKRLPIKTTISENIFQIKHVMHSRYTNKQYLPYPVLCLELLCALFMLFHFFLPDKFRCFLFSFLMISDHHKSIRVIIFFLELSTETTKTIENRKTKRDHPKKCSASSIYLLYPHCSCQKVFCHFPFQKRDFC